MTRPLQTVEEATPERLTALLENTGLLAGQRVKHVRSRKNAAFNSTIAHLELHLEDTARAPINLLLKLNRGNAGREEVAFYELAAKSGADTSALVPCLNASFDAESGTSHLLLQDVSGTHEAPVSREKLLALGGVPTKAHLQQVTEALAHVHATFWNHPLLGKQPAAMLTQRYQNVSTFDTWWDKHRQDYELLRVAHGETVSDDVHALLQGALEHAPKLWRRYVEPHSHTLSGLTVTHNDCYLTQFLCPIASEERTYLVDFQDACTDFAARDLVYLMATFWTREQRRVYERGVLEHYHRTLVEHGVRGFNLEQLFDDYRLMLIDMVFHPIWDTTYGADTNYWQPKLKCLTDAYSDWQCDALFR